MLISKCGFEGFYLFNIIIMGSSHQDLPKASRKAMVQRAAFIFKPVTKVFLGLVAI